MIGYPLSKPDAEYRVPDYCGYISGDIFSNATPQYLQTMYIGNAAGIDNPTTSWNGISYNSLVRVPFTLVPDDTNPHYKSVDNMLLTKDGKRIIQVPKGLQGALRIPDGVEILSPYLFWNYNTLELVSIPSSVTTVGNSAFFMAKNMWVRFEGDIPYFESDMNGTSKVRIFCPAGNETWQNSTIPGTYGPYTTWCDGENHNFLEAFIETSYSIGNCTDRYRCRRCSCGLSTNWELRSSGHDWTSWYTCQPVSCTHAGLIKRFCNNCKKIEFKVVSTFFAHEWIDSYDQEKTCAHCGITGTGYAIRLDNITDEGSVWIDGVEYPVMYEDELPYILLSDPDADSLVVYSYNDPNPEDIHTQYPTAMTVYWLQYENGRYQAEYAYFFDNILQYAGSSIRITGKKGIRMITGIKVHQKAELTGEISKYSGYTLVEYGTALCWASDLEGGKPMTLGQDYVKSNYAYKRGVADPIFAKTGSHVQYTNGLVGFSLDQCKDDIAMRPYIIVEDSDGNQFTLYGGIVYRSIGYIAYQNRNVFKPGNASYDYVWEIIHHVYGDQYDADYKG